MTVEKKIGKPVHWFICLLHINELPLRHLFDNLDGPTTGPKAFSGLLGKALQSCDKKCVVDFETIEFREPLRSIDVDGLSTDQNYLYKICIAVTSGKFHDGLEYRYPGNMCHSRWLKLANRILRLYASRTSPSGALKTLADYVVNVYAPSWFDIKCQSNCINGPKHLWKMIVRMRHLPETLQKGVLEPVIQRSAYYAHQENLLVSMINDDCAAIRELGFRRILKVRRDCAGKKQLFSVIRQFKVPEINFLAENYTELLHWESDHQRTEPPLTMKITEEELLACISNKKKLRQELFDFPCHTQAVERCVKLVTEASTKVCGKDRRDGFIRATVHSRRLMPRFESKKDLI